jgi:hypothetical protein
MNFTFDAACTFPKTLFFSFGEKLDTQSATYALENVANKIKNEKQKRYVYHDRKPKLCVSEKPANSSTAKSKLTRVVCKISRVVLILLPERFPGHLLGCGTPRVPGLFVGCGAGGFGGGGAGGGLLHMDFSLPNVKDEPRPQMARSVRQHDP